MNAPAAQPEIAYDDKFTRTDLRQESYFYRVLPLVFPSDA
jgi:hypothetical protein